MPATDGILSTTQIKTSAERRPVWLLPACLAWLAARLIYNGLRELTPDEAYYWVWSRHPAFGYLDHPPMVAWIIRASTALLGTSEFGVRSGAAVLTLGTILVTLALARQVGAPRNAILLAAGILLLSPITSVLGTIIAPDTPACLFGVCALAAAVAACSRSGVWWVVFGLCMGMALLSKYTAVLVEAAIGLAMLTTPAGRRQLCTVWPWLGVVIGAAIFWPVVEWNRENHWASFIFQWHHGAGVDAEGNPAPPASALANIGTYLGGQLVIYTPVLFVLGMAALGWQWRRIRQIGTAERMVLFTATGPLVFFLLFSVRHRPEPNWPVMAYLPMTVILVQWLSQAWNAAGARWARIGLVVAAAMMVVGQAPEIMLLIPVRVMPNIPRPWRQMEGWREFGKALDERSRGTDGQPATIVFCPFYESAAEASFYMQGHPEVWTTRGRLSAYDFFPGRPDETSLERIVCVRSTEGSVKIPAVLKGFTDLTVERWHATALGRVVRPWGFILARQDRTHP
jgi:4-amino-4-deoxy-L-arabinose transferase-like glycosyltransferase